MKNKLKSLQSTQMWSPVKDIKDGIVITKDDRFVRILEFAPVNFLLLPNHEKEYICDAFGSALRSFPNKFHLKVLSRKANVETHVRDLQNCLAYETNPLCREMQEDSIRQIQNDAVSGVSRRFFVSFDYEKPGGLRSPSWNDIKRDLDFTSRQIAGYLITEPCNNELLSPIGDSTHTMDILYNCMSRAQAEKMSSEDKLAEIVSNRMSQQNFSASDCLTIPINDFICPEKVEKEQFGYQVIDGKYYTFGYIHRTSYPNECVAGWISNLVNIGEGVDLDIWVEKRPTKEITSQLSYSMQLSNSAYMNQSTSSADRVNLQKKIQSENYLRNGLSNYQDFMFFSIMVTVVADSLVEMKEKFTNVQNMVLSYGLELWPCHGNHGLAMLSSIPLNAPHKKITRFAKRNILSGDLGAAYPFTSYEINDPYGILVGRNIANNSPLFLDFYNRRLYTNGNMLIFGSTGSGKTYTLSCLALRLRQYQTHTIIIAPYKGHEFRPACTAIGGTFISLAPGSPNNINIMEIRKYDTSRNAAIDGDEAKSSSILAAKIQQIHAFFSIIMPEISRSEKRILDEALLKTYQRFGITVRNKSLLDPRNPSQYKRMPLLGDLDRELVEFGKNATGLREALSRFVTGSARSFNSPTNVNLDNPYVVIDVSNMPDELLAVAMFIATDFVYDTLRADRIQKKAVILDEGSRLIGPTGSADVAKFVLQIYKTIRSYNGIVITATQDTNDIFAFKDGYYGKGISAAAKFKLIMLQEKEEAKTLSELLQLSQREHKDIAHFARGEGLLIANQNRAEIRIESSEAEHALITTDPEQLVALIAQGKRMHRPGSQEGR